MTTKKKKKATLEDLIKTLNLKQKKEKVDSHAYGEVKSINEDGTYNVSLGGTETTVKCARLAGAKVGDTVFVTILKNGFAVVTNTVGGDTDAADAQETATDAQDAADGAQETADAALAAYITIPVRSSQITLGSDSTETITLTVVGTVPAGYHSIGLLSLKNRGGRSKVSMTGWYLDGNTVKVDVYNASGSIEQVEYEASILYTNL